MRTQSIVVAVLCVAIAAGVFQLAPVGGTLIDGAGSGVDTSDVSDRANDSSVNPGEDFNGSAETQGEGSLIGTIIGGGQALFEVVGLVALLPNLLQTLGLPYWFAQPVGWGETIIGGIGAIQFVTGRRYT